MVEWEVTTPVVMLEVPGDGVGPGVQAGVAELLTQSEDQQAHDPLANTSTTKAM